MAIKVKFIHYEQVIISLSFTNIAQTMINIDHADFKMLKKQIIYVNILKILFSLKRVLGLFLLVAAQSYNDKLYVEKRYG